MADAARAARIRAVLDELRPFFTADGGDVEFVECTGDGVVKVRMVGACQGCPSAHNTLQNGILVALREVLPDVRGVEAV